MFVGGVRVGVGIGVRLSGGGGGGRVIMIITIAQFKHNAFWNNRRHSKMVKGRKKSGGIARAGERLPDKVNQTVSDRSCPRPESELKPIMRQQNRNRSKSLGIL